MAKREMFQTMRVSVKKKDLTRFLKKVGLDSAFEEKITKGNEAHQIYDLINALAIYPHKQVLTDQVGIKMKPVYESYDAFLKEFRPFSYNILVSEILERQIKYPEKTIYKIASEISIDEVYERCLLWAYNELRFDVTNQLISRGLKPEKNF